jgi:hypothetical protein
MSLVGQYSRNEKTPVVGGEGLLIGISEQMEATGELLTNFYLCYFYYFYLCMYGEADCFMTEDLMIKAEENFRDPFAQIITVLNKG